MTGFGPFPGQPDNPSARLVARLGAAFNVRAVVLPTEFAAAGAQLKAALDAHQPDVVVCFGVAAQSDQLRIERAAWNVVDTAKTDNAGHHHKGAVIRKDGPEGYASTLPLPGIHADLVRGGFPAVPSNDAGDYLCNYIFYQLMHDAAQNGARRRGGFVHIPVPREGSRLDEQGLFEAAAIIVRACMSADSYDGRPRVLRDRPLWTGKPNPV
ncbi:MAG: pyroglutamyl-peptidase I [Alphaproteobacteria bacterium]|nr:pyroglutamyl-peptidase I [Alphaproteobacteria bacterium]